MNDVTVYTEELELEKREVTARERLAQSTNDAFAPL
jgi:hypothetical protein